MIPKQDRKAGQLYALNFASNNLVYCVKAGEQAVVKIIWPRTYWEGDTAKFNWDRLRPVSDVYPSKHEIAKMIFGDVE
jgi:hypothetical protein